MILWINFLTFFYSVLMRDIKVKAHLLGNEDTFYKYLGEVRISSNEPMSHISAFEIYGFLMIRKYIKDSNLNNTYLLCLMNIEHSMHNGPETLKMRDNKKLITGEIALQLQKPFLAVYNDNNLLEGLKFQNTESSWSRNIKKSIAANLQVDTSVIEFTDDFRHSAFLTDERTIHGICPTSYDMHTIDHQEFSDSNSILITKTYNPKKCSEFIQSAFSHSENFECSIEREEDLIASTRKELHLVKSKSSLYLSKLVTLESFYYFPWMHISEIYHVQLRQILELQRNSTIRMDFEKVNFQSVLMTSDISFEKPTDNYTAVNIVKNITSDNHRINQFNLILKINKMIFEIVDYIDVNHLTVDYLSFEHEQVVKRLMISIAKLDFNSMELLYNRIKDPETSREESGRKIFLEMIPHIGTTASCLFILNIVTRQKYDLPDNDIISMLSKYPSYVRHPTEKLLFQMEELLQMNKSNKYFIKSKQVKKAAILSFASLVYKTFKRITEYNPPLLETYLQYISTYLQDRTNSNYEMKLVHIMALRNIQVGGIEQILIPIISGELVIHKRRQEQTRLAASFAVSQAINHDKELVYNLFWPILSNSMNSLQLRIMAYDMLISQLPDAERAMNIHWLMANEQNKHLYHYHYTTIKSLANLKDPCLRPVMELAQKIWRLTKDRNISGPISGSYIINYLDLKYGYGETYKLAMNIDDDTGLPRMGIFEYYHSIGRRSSPVWGIYWNTNIFASMLHALKHIMLNKKIIITNDDVKEILRKTKKYESSVSETGYIEILALARGRVIQVSAIYNEYLNNEGMLNSIRHVIQHVLELNKTNIEINWQSLTYKDLNEISVSSDMGLPITFYNHQSLLLSTRMKFEFSTLSSTFNMKFTSDNRIWRQASYELMVFNPISNVSQSVERVSTIDVIFPIELDISYDLVGQKLKLKFLRSLKTKNRGIRKHVSSHVNIYDDERNVLRDYCPLCLHYNFISPDSNYLTSNHDKLELQDLGLVYVQSSIDCTSDTLITRTGEWLRILKDTDSKFMDDLNYSLFLSISHMIFNEIISPNPGTCRNMISIAENDDNVNHIEINLGWKTKLAQMESNLNDDDLSSSENMYFYSSVNTVSSFNCSSIALWRLNVTLHNDNNIQVYFIQKIPGRKNIIGCIHSQKSNSSSFRISTKITFDVDILELDQCGTGLSIINGTVTSKYLEMHNNMDQEKKYACSKEKSDKNDQDFIFFSENHLFNSKENYKLQKCDTNIFYSQIPEGLISIIHSLDETIRTLYFSKIKYMKNNTQDGHLKVNLIFAFSQSKGVNVQIFTPSVSYELCNLSLKFINSIFVKNKINLLANKICNIFPETIILNNNEKESAKLTDWALISGDYMHFSFAIFARVVQENKIAVKLYHGAYYLEIQPIQDSTFKLILNHIEIKNYKNKTDLTYIKSLVDNTIISIKLTDLHLEIELIQISINILYANNSLTITEKNTLLYGIDGLCANSGYYKIVQKN